MDIRLIQMFNVALEGNEVPYERIAEVAMKAGYVVDPKCSTVDVLSFLREMKMNPNSTFYKTWEDITSKTRFALFLDQIRHYASTYGTIDEPILNAVYTTSGDGTVSVEYNVSGNGYVPNSNPIFIEWKKFKVIKPATKEDIAGLIMKMFSSGSALNSDTINACTEFLKQENLLDKIDVDAISNKEAQATIACLLKKFPIDEFGLLRCIVYTYTGKTMLIKDRETIRTIEGVNGFNPKSRFDFARLSDRQLKSLSRIFYRYKPLFLAMKGYADNSKYINRIRRLAEKNHTPLKKGFWETCLNDSGKDFVQLINTAKSSVGELNNFRKVQLMQSIMNRIVGKNMNGKMYVIRNGKMFVREGYKPHVNTVYLMQLYNVLKEALVESLKSKATTFKIQPGVHIACPTSEKNFVGNYPMGTHVDFSEGDNVIGVYWRNEWGTRDFDLHVCDDLGNSFGWRSSFYDQENNIIYSGDMTNADPEATELFYFKKGVPDGVVNLCKYNGDETSHYRLFVAKGDYAKKATAAGKLGHYRGGHPIMVDPNDIVFDAMCDFNGEGQQTIAYLHDNKLYFMQLQSGRGRVPRNTNNDIIQQANKVKMDSFIDLIPILEEAGFTQVTGNTGNVVEAKKEVKSVDVAGLSKEEAIAKVTAEMEKVEAENEKAKEVVEVKYDFTALTKEMLLELFA